MIINDTYFINDISLPTDTGNYLNKLNSQIEKTEKKYLLKILGYELYSLFVSELPDPTTERFINLLNGHEYTNIYSGLLDKWDGLKNNEKESFLSYFTYYEYLMSSQVNESGEGTTINEFENSKKSNPVIRLTRSFNEGVRLYNRCYDYLISNSSEFPEWNFTYIKKVTIFNI